ncbi:MAG: hypothetical protein Q4G28_05330 [Neisseria sp.]|nr:hypothetical protein [Neisseria sp.]
MNKRNGLMLAGILSLALATFPSSDSEAQSAEMPLSEFSCQKLNLKRLERMSDKQRIYAAKCDMAEAGLAWEQSYGGLSHDELVAGIVYE